MSEGLLLLDKPKGMTSHDVIYQLRKILNIKQIGHCGTLDPFATGVLLVLVGKATKLSKYFVEKDKSYLATMILGKTSDTLDSTGNVIETKPVSHILPSDVNSALQSMLGHQIQSAPAYSAVKIGGHKLYELARKDKLPETLPTREVDVFEISMGSNWEKSDETIRFQFSCKVSKGTYIRSLAKDIAEKLGNVGMLTDLQRLSTGMFTLDKCNTLEDVRSGQAQFYDPISVLDLPKMQLSEDQSLFVSHGRPLDAMLFETTADTLLLDYHGNPLAIYQYDSQQQIMRMSVYLR